MAILIRGRITRLRGSGFVGIIKKSKFIETNLVPATDEGACIIVCVCSANYEGSKAGTDVERPFQR